MIKFGVSQFSKPAPIGWRNFSNAMIIFILPAIVVVVQGWGFKNHQTQDRLMLILSFLPAFIKGIGTLLGNGQYYTSNPRAADEKPPLDELTGFKNNKN